MYFHDCIFFMYFHPHTNVTQFVMQQSSLFYKPSRTLEVILLE